MWAFSIERPTSLGRNCVRIALVASNRIVPSLKTDTSLPALNIPFSRGSGVFVLFSKPFVPLIISVDSASPPRLTAAANTCLRSTGLFLYETVSTLQFLQTPSPGKPHLGHDWCSTVKVPHVGHRTRGSHASQLGQTLSTTSRVTASLREASTISRRIPPNWPVGKRQ